MAETTFRSSWPLRFKLCADVYPRFARVLNHIYEGTSSVFTWKQISAPFGIKVDASTQWSEIEPHLEPGMMTRSSLAMGTLDDKTAHSLTTVFREFTREPESITFAFWEGYSDVPQDHGETIELPPGRDYWLAGGNLGNIVTGAAKFPFDRRPIRWWPNDHTWCVGNDIHARSIFIGGSEDLIDTVLNTPDLEAYETDVGMPVYNETL